jgi:phosphoribosyl 1,2-cyclic phosphodiesterase
MTRRAGRPDAPTEFEVWGCRGSRSFVPHRSAIGNYTSCYSIRQGVDLVVLDAGRGLAALGWAMSTRKDLRKVERVHVLVTHAHLDHWEGLKDADWFWRKGTLEVSILGSAQALQAIQTAYGHPLYVNLELLAAGRLRSVRYETLEPGDTRAVGGWAIETAPLHHYSGDDHARQWLDTLGFRVKAPDGATVAYLCDHEPHRGTREVEERLMHGSHLAVYDAHFPDIREHAHGHGSQEHAASMARSHAGLIVLAGHHGPTRTDAEIRAGYRRHRRGVPNFRLAIEGARWRFDARRSAFVEPAAR